jgi:predicted site-specific integrase-resolvase
MNRFVKIGEAANCLGVTTQTLRRWERTGELLPARKSASGTRYYDIDLLKNKRTHSTQEKTITVAYARVSSHDQKSDLERQVIRLSDYCSAHGWQFEVIQDLGSGMNYRKKGLRKLLNLIIGEKINRLVLTNKDRLLRFGAELIFSLCEAKQIEVVLINQGEDMSFEEELAQDVLEIITVFSARLYGARSHKNKKLIEAAKILVAD